MRLREVLNNSFGPIRIEQNIPPAPSTADLLEKTGLEGVKVSSQRTVIQPRLGADGFYDFHYATQYGVDDSESGEHFAITLANNDQSILEVTSSHSHVKQELSVETYKVSYVLKDQHAVPFSNVRVDALAADANGVVDTAATTSTLSLDQRSRSSPSTKPKAQRPPIPFR